MLPVYQTVRGARGNCFAACVASILELPLARLPEYLDEAGAPAPRWLAIWNEFLRPFGLGIIWTRPCACSDCYPPAGYAIMAVAAPKDEDPGNTHAVVCYDGQVVHDPLDHEVARREPYVPDHWYVFTVRDPLRGVYVRAQTR